MNNDTNCNINDIYKLEGGVSIAKAIPLGLQHILAMSVFSPASITIIAGVAQPALSQVQTATLLQNAMFVAGIVAMIQLCPIWRIDSKPPAVTDVSPTFVTVLSTIIVNYGYPAVVGAVLIGDIFEGILGLLTKYQRKIITPVVVASMVIAIGFSLFTVDTRSLGGGYADDLGSAQNLILGTITLLTCLLWSIFAKGYLEQLSVLAGLIVGYVTAIFLGEADLGLTMSGGIISFPYLFPFMPGFYAGAVISACIIFPVSAAETIGDTSALVSGGLNREVTGKEIPGSLACDGYVSIPPAVFGYPPVTPFSQSVGLVVMTRAVNRFTIITGTTCMILAGLLPSVGSLLAPLSQTVLGGCATMMSGTVLTPDVQMAVRCSLSQRNVVAVPLSLAVGIGLIIANEIGVWDIFPESVQSVFSANTVVVIFVVSVFLSLALPKDVDIKALEE